MSDHGIQALDELRESLREAARREIAARPRRRRSRRRIGGLAAVLVVLAGGAAATAADLISEGAPVKPQSRFAVPSRYQPTQAGGRLALTAHDTPAPWGVEVYRSQEGQDVRDRRPRARRTRWAKCVDGTFHAYEPGADRAMRGPAERRRSRRARSWSAAAAPIYWGLAAPGIKRSTASVDGKSYPPARTGLDGAFLFVFKGPVGTALGLVGS